MDGPNVNLKVLDLLQKEINLQRSSSIIDVGTCGLHTVHNAFERGYQAANWNVGAVMSAMHWLFKDSPARREDFTEATGLYIYDLWLH